MSDAEVPPPRNVPRYVRPTLERLGTIRDLTRGTGKKDNFDNEHPPGQNKSHV